jgi:hypothetical protein
MPRPTSAIVSPPPIAVVAATATVGPTMALTSTSIESSVKAVWRRSAGTATARHWRMMPNTGSISIPPAKAPPSNAPYGRDPAESQKAS